MAWYRNQFVHWAINFLHFWSQNQGEFVLGRSRPGQEMSWCSREGCLYPYVTVSQVGSAEHAYLDQDVVKESREALALQLQDVWLHWGAHLVQLRLLVVNRDGDEVLGWLSWEMKEVKELRFWGEKTGETIDVNIVSCSNLTQLLFPILSQLLWTWLEWELCMEGFRQELASVIVKGIGKYPVGWDIGDWVSNPLDVVRELTLCHAPCKFSALTDYSWSFLTLPTFVGNLPSL